MTAYVDAAVRHYKQKWELPEVLNNMGVSNETLIDLKELRTNATIGLLTFASYSQEKAHKLVHGVSLLHVCDSSVHPSGVDAVLWLTLG